MEPRPILDDADICPTCGSGRIAKLAVHDGVSWVHELRCLACDSVLDTIAYRSHDPDLPANGMRRDPETVRGPAGGSCAGRQSSSPWSPWSPSWPFALPCPSCPFLSWPFAFPFPPCPGSSPSVSSWARETEGAIEAEGDARAGGEERRSPQARSMRGGPPSSTRATPPPTMNAPSPEIVMTSQVVRDN